MFTRNIFGQLCINRESGDTSTEKSTAKSIEMEKQKKRDINANINGKKELMKKNNVEIGKEEVLAIRNRFPTKIPVSTTDINLEFYYIQYFFLSLSRSDYSSALLQGKQSAPLGQNQVSGATRAHHVTVPNNNKKQNESKVIPVAVFAG